ncbi:hypothetical protein RhiirA1_119785 [Rhizophagus irregularis]|uniref:Uncharacterized protein n=1 Tax=Rhizophagus irregularis TaxID=588596 RepID=A0A2N0S2H8_9GLOM|nr:hypothetical protein RhiirA1_119785 [Rhizophagus irregularis]GET60020.1 hypothetical protein RIR_e31076_A0A2N0S2H8_9GLOM [Rhizophagus irregularis DAOM 181602=DAOM 197198]
MGCKGYIVCWFICILYIRFDYAVFFNAASILLSYVTHLVIMIHKLIPISDIVIGKIGV